MFQCQIEDDELISATYFAYKVSIASVPKLSGAAFLIAILSRAALLGPDEPTPEEGRE